MAAIKCILSTYWFSEDTDEHGRPNLITHRYPPALPRRQPDWLGIFGPLPEDIRRFLVEIYNALENDSLRLCGLGVRALLEQIMVTEVGDQGSIGENITAFLNAGFVAPRQHKQFRDKLIEVGNAAMHRGYRPNRAEIDTLLDITENLVESIYVHPGRAEGIGRDMPARARRRGDAQ